MVQTNQKNRFQEPKPPFPYFDQVSGQVSDLTFGHSVVSFDKKARTSIHKSIGEGSL